MKPAANRARPPSIRQIDYASSIAGALKLPLPDEYSMSAYRMFISDNVMAYRAYVDNLPWVESCGYQDDDGHGNGCD